MGSSYFPSGDADRITWLVTFKNQFAASAGTYGFDPVVDIPSVSAAIDATIAAYYAWIAAADAARSARAAKDLSMDDLVRDVIRSLVNRLQAHPAMTDPVRMSYGITVRDGEPTPAGSPPTVPVLQVDLRQRQVHTISFADEGTPTQKAKPRGVHHVEIWYVKGGPTPTDDGQWLFLASDTATPYVNSFELADIGTTVWYRARWVDNDGTVGSWGAIESAKVPG